MTIQTANMSTATNSAGVTTTTPITIATQPSHLGSNAPRRIARPLAKPKTQKPAELVKTMSLLSRFNV